MFRDFAQMTKDSLSRLWNRELLVFFFFLFLSALFWVFMTFNEDYKDDIAIPMELVNVPENIVITTEPPKELKVNVKGKGFSIFLYKHVKQFQPIVLDFTKLKGKSGHITLHASELQPLVAEQLASGTQINGFRPQQIEIYYNSGESKRVPVRFVGQITPVSMSYISQMSFSPDSVTVYAQKQILDTITAAYTDRYFVKNVEDTLRKELMLETTPGIKFLPEKVRLTAVTDRLVEKTVQVPIRQVNFPATKQLRTFPAKVNVTFQVGMRLYRSITADNFVLVVNYEDLLENNSSRCRLMLKSLPAGVRHAKISPQEVDYVIEELPENEN